MNAAVHELRARLRRHEPSLIVNVDYPSAGLVERLSQLDIQAVMFDTEQGSPDIESIEHMARAARLHEKCSLVRTFNAEPWAIERLSMRGSDGLIVPRAETLDDVRRIVADFDYCVPADRADRLLVVQLEHRQLLHSLQELAAIPDIDCIFIGPVDLSKSMGYRGRYDLAPVDQEIRCAIRTLREQGMPVGMLVKPNDIGSWIDAGASFLYLHAYDLLELGAAAIRDRVTAR